MKKLVKNPNTTSVLDIQFILSQPNNKHRSCQRYKHNADRDIWKPKIHAQYYHPTFMALKYFFV